MVFPCVDTVSGDFGWLVETVAGVSESPRALHAGNALEGWLEMKWAQTEEVLGLSTQRTPWQDR